MILVLCTCSDNHVADTIAQTLVEERLAACVNYLPNILSTYRWKGKVHQDSEVLLLIKTTTDRFYALKTRILEIHPYELPEIIAVDVSLGLDRYLKWILEETRSI